MFHITNNEGNYLYGFVGHNPIWTDCQDAKTYPSLQEAEADEKRLEDLKVHCFVIPA